MNETELRIYFNHMRSQRMAEADQRRLKAQVLRKAGAGRRLHLTQWFGRTIGGVIARRSTPAASPQPARLEDCVGLDMP